MEKFDVLDWRTGEVKFTAEIECGVDALPSVKLGLAVKWAIKERKPLDYARLDYARLDGASLDGASLVGARLVGARLDGASLDGASLDGARLDGASLVGARLDGASLDGASIRDKKIKRVIAIICRINDPYTFTAFETDSGEVWIMAGCRWFSLQQYRRHVLTYAARPKGVETIAILDFISARATALGIGQAAEA